MLDSNWAVAISHFEKAVKLGTLKSNDIISANIELSEAYRYFFRAKSTVNYNNN